MSDTIESYKLGDIDVTITTTDDANKYKVTCLKGEEEYSFIAKKNEYESYKRLMNRRILKEFG